MVFGPFPATCRGISRRGMQFFSVLNADGELARERDPHMTGDPNSASLAKLRWLVPDIRCESGDQIYIDRPKLVGGLELFFHILGIIIPIDEHIFQRGRYTTNQFFSVRMKISFRLTHVFGRGGLITK